MELASYGMLQPVNPFSKCLSFMPKPVLHNVLLFCRTLTLVGDTSAEDQQVGSLWQGDHLVSLSLSGNLNYWSLDQDKPVRIVQVSIAVLMQGNEISSESKYICFNIGSFQGHYGFIIHWRW